MSLTSKYHCRNMLFVLATETLPKVMVEKVSKPLNRRKVDTSSEEDLVLEMSAPAFAFEYDQTQHSQARNRLTRPRPIFVHNPSQVEVGEAVVSGLFHQQLHPSIRQHDNTNGSGITPAWNRSKCATDGRLPGIETFLKLLTVHDCWLKSSTSYAETALAATASAVIETPRIGISDDNLPSQECDFDDDGGMQERCYLRCAS